MPPHAFALVWIVAGGMLYAHVDVATDRAERVIRRGVLTMVTVCTLSPERQ